MKTLYSILLSLLLVAMAAVGVYSLVDVDATTSKTENRDLAKKPAFSIAGLFDGSYISSLEKYYSDTFPGRDALLSANKSLNGFYHFSGGGESNMLVVDFQGGVEQGGQALNPDHATDAEDTPETPDDTELPPEEITVSTDEPDEPETPETPETTTPDEEEESHGDQEGPQHQPRRPQGPETGHVFLPQGRIEPAALRVRCRGLHSPHLPARK